MKILHIIINLSSGGAQKLVEEMVPMMNEAEGVEADVLLLSGEDNVFNKQLVAAGVNIHIVPVKRMKNPLQIFYIASFIKKGGYDAVHAHLFPANYWTAAASTLLFKNKPEMVTTEHNTNNRRRKVKLIKYLDKWVYSRFDKIISISEETEKNLLTWINPREKQRHKYRVIPNGINLEKFSRAQPYNKSDLHPHFTEDTILLCMVGSFSEQKDQAAIIKAVKGLPEDVHVLLIGEGELKKKHEKLSQELNVESRVHFLGFRDDVERVFKTSDIVIVSSHWEGFGLVAAEGMAAGKPVLASDVPGLAAVVGDPELLFEAGNSRQLAAMIHQLTTDKYKYESLAETCKQRSTSHDIRTMTEKYLGEYKERDSKKAPMTEADFIHNVEKELPGYSPDMKTEIEKVRDNVYIFKTGLKQYLVKLVRQEDKKKLGRVQKAFQNSSFRNEIEVNNALKKMDFEYLKFPQMIETKGKDYVIFEYIEAPAQPGFMRDPFIPPLIEFQLAGLNIDLSWKDRLILAFRNKVSLNILRWSLDVILPRFGWKTALQCVLLFAKSSRKHKALEQAIHLHNDFGGNTILTSKKELYVIDFESVINEKKWILVDVLQRVFNEENFSVNQNDLSSYIVHLSEQLSAAPEEMNVKIQLRILLMRRMMQLLRSGSRNAKRKEEAQQFLIHSVLSDDGYDLWYAQNIGNVTLNELEVENSVL